MPYLCAAGEFDELSPLHNTERLLKSLQGPKRFVVYQEARHATARSVRASRSAPKTLLLYGRACSASPRTPA